MYRAELVKARIKQMCAIRGITVEKMLKDCGLGVNAVNQIGGKRGMSSKSISVIAGYLGCTIEHLLGCTSDEFSDFGEVDGFVRKFMSNHIFAELIRIACGMNDISLQRMIDVAEMIKDGKF